MIDQAYLKEIENNKKKLRVKKVDLVICESLVFHQNTYGKPNSEERLVQYVSFMAKNNPRNTKNNQEKRIKYFNEKRMTGHWQAPVNVNGLQPHTYGDDSLLIDYDSLPEIILDDMIEEINKLI